MTLTTTMLVVKARAKVMAMIEPRVTMAPEREVSGARFLDEMRAMERMGEASALTMDRVGPVSDAFISDRAMITAMMGPYGSAKTTSCFQKIIRIALWQNPGRDGVRRIRVCVVRPTYGQLEDTVMKDWFSWFPKTRENWNGEKLDHKIRVSIPEIAELEIEMCFRAVDDRDKAEKVFKGMQLTVLWLNEADTCHPAVLEFGMPRLGRYPSSNMGGCAWSGVIMDFNAPDSDNWIVPLVINGDLGLPQSLVDALRDEFGPEYGVGFHRQPGGRDPNAENLHNLPRGYYEKLMAGKSENYIRRFVDNQLGAVRNGQPVYPEFNDGFHMAPEGFKPVEGVPLCMALDAGSTPALVFGQRLPGGQIRVVDELVVLATDESVMLEKLGPEAFGTEAAEYWLEHFPTAKLGEAWIDPAGLDGDEYTDAWGSKFWAAFKKRAPAIAGRKRLKVAPVKGNRLPERIEPVRALFLNNPGGKPGIFVSPRCKTLRRGFNNGYVIVRTKMSNGHGRWKDEPLKNDWSHVQDALQYLVAGLIKRGDGPGSDVDVDGRSRARREREPRRANFGGSRYAPK